MSIELLLPKFGSNIAEIRRRAVDSFFLKIRCSIINAADLISSTSIARLAVDSLVAFTLAEWQEPRQHTSADDHLSKVITLLSELIHMSVEAKSALEGRVDGHELLRCLVEHQNTSNSESIRNLLKILSASLSESSQQSEAVDKKNSTESVKEHVPLRPKEIETLCSCLIVRSCVKDSQIAGYRPQNLDDVRTIDEAVRTILVATSTPLIENETQLLRALYSIRFLLFVELPVGSLVEHPRFPAVLFSLIGSDQSRSDGSFIPVIDTVAAYLQRIVRSEPTFVPLFLDVFLNGIELLTDAAHRRMAPQQQPHQANNQSSLNSVHTVAYIVSLVARLLFDFIGYRKFLTEENYCCRSEQCRRIRVLTICASLADLASEVAIIYGIDAAHHNRPLHVAEKQNIASQLVVTVQRLMTYLVWKNCIPFVRSQDLQGAKSTKRALLASVSRTLRSHVLCPASYGHRIPGADDNIYASPAGFSETELLSSAVQWIEASGCDLGLVVGNSSTRPCPCRAELAKCVAQAVSARKAAQLKALLVSTHSSDETEEVNLESVVEPALLALPNVNDTELIREVVRFAIGVENGSLDAPYASLVTKIFALTAETPSLMSPVLHCLQEATSDIVFSLLRDINTAFSLIALFGRSQPAMFSVFLTRHMASTRPTIGVNDSAFENSFACLPLVLVPVYAQAEHVMVNATSSFVASFISTGLFSDSDNISLAFLSACARTNKAPNLRRDGVKKLALLVPGLSIVTGEAFGNLLTSIVQSPARCTQLASTRSGTYLDNLADINNKIDNTITSLATFSQQRSQSSQLPTSGGGDLASAFNDLSTLLQNSASHARFLAVGGLDMLVLFLQSELSACNYRARAHLLMALKWLALGTESVRKILYNNAKCLRAVACLLNDSVTAGAAAALLSILSLHRLSALHSVTCRAATTATLSSLVLPQCLEADYELPVDFKICPTCLLTVSACPPPKSSSHASAVASSPVAAWARCHYALSLSAASNKSSQRPLDRWDTAFEVNSTTSSSDNKTAAPLFVVEIVLWTSSRIFDGALRSHLTLARESQSHEHFLAALLGFELVFASVPSYQMHAFKRSHQGDDKGLHEIVVATIGRLLDGKTHGDAATPLSSFDCRCLAAAARTSTTVLRIAECQTVQTVDLSNFVNILLPRYCRFAVEALANLLASKYRNPDSLSEASVAAVLILDFIIGGIRYLLLVRSPNSPVRFESFAVDILRSISEILSASHVEGTDSTSAAALVGLLARRFTEAALPFRPAGCPTLISLLPSSKFDLIVSPPQRSCLTLSGDMPDALHSSPISLACALLPRSLFALRASAIASSRECAILALTAAEKLGISPLSIISSFVCAPTAGGKSNELESSSTMMATCGLMAAARLLELSCQCPSDSLLAFAKRLVAGSDASSVAHLQLRSAAACFMATSVMCRNGLAEMGKCASEFSVADLAACLRSAATATGAAVAEGRIVSGDASLLLFSCTLANLVRAVFCSAVDKFESSSCVEPIITGLVSFLPEEIVFAVGDDDDDDDDNKAADDGGLPLLVKSEHVSQISHMLSSALLPTLTVLVSKMGRWPPGVLSALRTLSLVAKQVLAKLMACGCGDTDNVPLCYWLCRFYCAVLAADLLDCGDSSASSLSTASMLILEMVPLDAVMVILRCRCGAENSSAATNCETAVNSSNHHLHRHTGAVMLQMLCSAAVRSDSAMRNRIAESLYRCILLSASPSSNQVETGNFAEQLILANGIRQPYVTVACIRAVSSLLVLLRHSWMNLGDDDNGKVRQIILGLFKSVRVWQRITALAKRIQSSVYSLSSSNSATQTKLQQEEMPNDLRSCVFEELSALLDLLDTACCAVVSSATGGGSSTSNGCEELSSSSSSSPYAGILPIVCATVMSIAVSPTALSSSSSTTSTTSPGVISTISKLGYWKQVVKNATVTANCSLGLARTLVAAQVTKQWGCLIEQAVSFADVSQLAEMVARFLPDLLAADVAAVSQKWHRSNKTADAEQAMMMMMMMSGKNSSAANSQAGKSLASSALDFLCTVAVSSARGVGRVFCTRLPQRIAQRLLTLPAASSSQNQFSRSCVVIDERKALLRLLRSAALIWPAGHQLILSDASELYMPLLNDWAGSERDAEAIEVLQLLARRGKTARRLGLTCTSTTSVATANISSSPSTAGNRVGSPSSSSSSFSLHNKSAVKVPIAGKQS